MSDYETKTDKPIQKGREQEPSPNSYCRKCGAALGAGAKFCGTCGTPVDADLSGQATGQELQQLADSAKAVAKAGMENARKNVAKGLGAAGERISSAAEKMNQDRQPGGAFRESGTGENIVREGTELRGKWKKIWKAASGVVSVIIVIFILINLFGNDPVRDMKSMKFDQYGSQTFGEAVKASIPEASWHSTKIDGKHYTVTVSGFCPDVSSNIQIELDVNYSGEYIYAKPVGLVMDGEHYDDIFTIALVMGAIYE